MWILTIDRSKGAHKLISTCQNRSAWQQPTNRGNYRCRRGCWNWLAKSAADPWISRIFMVLEHKTLLKTTKEYRNRSRNIINRKRGKFYIEAVSKKNSTPKKYIFFWIAKKFPKKKRFFFKKSKSEKNLDFSSFKKIIIFFPKKNLIFFSNFFRSKKKIIFFRS